MNTEMTQRELAQLTPSQVAKMVRGMNKKTGEAFKKEYFKAHRAFTGARRRAAHGNNRTVKQATRTPFARA